MTSTSKSKSEIESQSKPSRTGALIARLKVPLTLAISLTAGLVILVLVVALLLISSRPITGESKSLTITEGTSRQEIGLLLEREGIIRSRWPFYGLVFGLNRVLKSGTYTLSPASSLVDIVAIISIGKERTIRITFREGLRREEMAQLLTDKGYDGQLFLSQTTEKEGRLFPDTYFFAPDTTIEAIISTMENNFSKRTADLAPTQDQIILASIIEREAQRDDQRALIAGIFVNRIKAGMKLDADPTVQYGRDTNFIDAGTPPSTYWKSITLANYTNVVSPYNTYLNTGYPPTAICNPGLKSLVAAANPEVTKAYYFFHRLGGDIITSKTLEEHNTNKVKFLR